ncbi:hypothetical protein BAU15_00750 [Enterococcus sp. JM4C]|uniref:PTS transporter subunit EIIC n=1 Tax=Candidatus Enterococcus huntleyi TaxID=1857217 RepID=UPI001379CDA2|nr:PTS transporter subunit EIIC [Enterococcus sp. JM4C]KAF1299207.1 hypothetical protein BAU15_00750 [Enterococcus sp. JM4C]
MGKYEGLAEKLIEYVGGEDNIISLVHCATRLRFELKDESVANDEAVTETDGVLSLVKKNGQYQIVVGPKVTEVYKEINSKLGFKNSDPIDVSKEPKKKKGPLNVAQEYISAIMMPLLNIMCASGMLKGILACLPMLGVNTDAGIFTVLNVIGDALFAFLPIFIGFTAAKKFRLEPFLGATLGAILVHPALQNLDKLNVLGIDASGLSYTATVIPIVLVVMLAAPLERFLNRLLPEMMRAFFTPIIVLVVCGTIGFTVIGPVANSIAEGFKIGMVAVSNFSPILNGLLLGGLWQVLVIFGIHQPIGTILTMDLILGNPSQMIPIIAPTGFAQSAVVLMIWLKTKDKKLKALALPAWISGSIFGVTEPAIYGITLPRIKFFIISCIGSALGGAYIAVTKVTAYNMGGWGMFAFPQVISERGGVANVVNYFIAIAIAVIFSLVATLFLYKDPVEDSE